MFFFFAVTTIPFVTSLRSLFQHKTNSEIRGLYKHLVLFCSIKKYYNHTSVTNVFFFELRFSLSKKGLNKDERPC